MALSNHCLNSARGRFLSLGVLATSLLLLIISFATSKEGQTLFGPPLGADFAGFYTAGALLNGFPADRLYDFDLQNVIYHETLPRLRPEDCLPYVHPPFVALCFRPLAA